VSAAVPGLLGVKLAKLTGNGVAAVCDTTSGNGCHKPQKSL
jgi:hypothetical protein